MERNCENNNIANINKINRHPEVILRSNVENGLCWLLFPKFFDFVKNAWFSTESHNVAQSHEMLKQHDNIVLLKKKIAFTLAEVLITLSILGVVAAISIPSIIQNYQKQATVSRLKMAYSMLDRLTQQSYIENGYPPIDSDLNNGAPDRFHNYFGKYLNIAKDCGYNNSLGCFKEGSFNLSSTGEKPTNMAYTLDGSRPSNGYNLAYYYTVLLKNGMSLGVWYRNLTHNPGYIFLVDIDGPNRGDSKVGQDVFQFVYYSPQLPGTKYCQNVMLFPGMLTTSDADSGCNISRAKFLNYCKENGTYQGQRWNGMGCSGLIIKDGWKISSDYPWAYAHKR